MDHNWNLIPPIVDLLDGYFEIILLPFFLDIELKIWVPRAPLSSLNLIPISCIKNFDSAMKSWTMLFALLANVQCADRSSSFLLLIQAMMFFFCSCNCELAASRSFCTLLHTTHCCDDLLPTNGGVCPEMTTRDPYFYHPMAGGSSSPSKGITLYLTMESDKFTALYPSKG